MRALVVAALMASASLAQGQSARRELWTIPWGWLDGTLRVGAPDLPTNGRISLMGVQGGEEFVRRVAERSPALVGGGGRVPLEIAEYPHVGDGYTEAVLVPRRPLRPRTVYRLAFEATGRSSATERAALGLLQERSYLTGPGPDGTLPEWTGEPQVCGEASILTLEARARWVHVVLPSTPVPFARVTLVCPGGPMLETRCYPVSGDVVRIPEDGCSAAPGVDRVAAEAAIIELLDRDGKVSAPRRVAFPSPADSGPGATAASGPWPSAREWPAAAWPRARRCGATSWPLCVLAFVLAPFVAGYAGVSLLVRRRRR